SLERKSPGLAGTRGWVRRARRPRFRLGHPPRRPRPRRVSDRQRVVPRLHVALRLSLPGPGRASRCAVAPRAGVVAAPPEAARRLSRPARIPPPPPPPG